MKQKTTKKELINDYTPSIRQKDLDDSMVLGFYLLIGIALLIYAMQGDSQALSDGLIH